MSAPDAKAVAAYLTTWIKEFVADVGKIEGVKVTVTNLTIEIEVGAADDAEQEGTDHVRTEKP